MGMTRIIDFGSNQYGCRRAFFNVILLVLTLHASALGEQTTFYVAVDGNDANPGTLAKPFGTLGRAREALRQEKLKQSSVQPLRVVLRKGKYFLDKAFVLGEEDGGTRDSPVIYENYKNETVVISGGVPLTGWQKYRGDILKASLPPGDWHISCSRQLTWNGKLQTRARYPNWDAQANPLIGAYINIEDAAVPGSDTAFRYADGGMPRRHQKPHLGEALVEVAGGWSSNVVPIKSISYEDQIVTLQHRTWHSEADNFVRYRHMPFRKRGKRDSPFVLFNLIEELDEPGEWCLDTEEGVVYFWPPEPMNSKSEVVLTKLRTLIDIHGSSNLVMRGLKFTETGSGENYHRFGLDGYGAQFPIKGWDYCGEAIYMRKASYCKIEDCEFYALGGNGIYLAGENLKNNISYNRFAYVGSNGVSLLGTKQAHPFGNRVTNNRFDKTGWINHYTASIFAGLSNGNLIAHNEIFDTPHHAVNLATNGFGRNVLEYNRIARTSLVLHDTGAVNMWMDPYAIDEEGNVQIVNRTDRCGHILRFNHISDSNQGYYLDDWTSNCIVYGNIFDQVWNGVTIHGGRNNLIENNIFYDCGCLTYCANDLVARGKEAEFMHAYCVGNRVNNNIYHSGKDSSKSNLYWFYTIDQPGYEEEFPAIEEKRFAQIERNTYFMETGTYQIGESWSVKPWVIYQWDDWQKLGYDTTSVIADPMLVDPENDNFNLHPDSPALDQGFQPIDMSKIGIQSPN